MGETIPIAVPRKGRPLESVLDRLADRLGVPELADDITSTLRHEKALTKGTIDPDEEDVYHRLAEYSAVDDPTEPEYTLLRDDRAGKPRRIVFDSVTIPLTDVEGAPTTRPFNSSVARSRFAPCGPTSSRSGSTAPTSSSRRSSDSDRSRSTGSPTLMPESIPPTPTSRSSPGLAIPSTIRCWPRPKSPPASGSLDRDFLETYEGPVCIEPRYERLVQAVLGTRALEGIEFYYPEEGREEEAAIADAGLGVYLTVTGSTAREHGLLLGEQLFPSETVLLENSAETTETVDLVRSLLNGGDLETELAVGP